MNKRLRCGFVQFGVERGAVEANLAAAAAGVARIGEHGPDIVALPELWSCGFDYPRLAAHCERTPEVLAEARAWAGRFRTMIAGSLPEEEDGAVYNTMFLVGPDGVIGRHRKSRLFSPMGEDRFFTPGPAPGPWETDAVVMAPLVCFELRFPELARGPVAAGADLVVVSAQWPAERIGQWELLLAARAVENQAFVLAANACGRGPDAPGGRSLVTGPDGGVIARAGDGEAAECVEIDLASAAALRGRFLTAAFPRPASAADKIVPRARVRDRLAPWRGRGRVVFTNGCFDILHPGHAAYLEQARRLGDCLVVGLNSDASVRRLKGDSRPVNREEDRARMLAALACVDLVVVFGEDTPLELIREVEPDVLVKGGDWPVEKMVGADFVRGRGGRAVSVPLVEGRSTTGIIEKIVSGARS